MQGQVIIRDFSGRLNYDDSPYALPKGDFVGALNITRDQVTGQSDLVISNIKGNRIVSYNLPSGENTVIGARGDVLRGKIYIFIYNTNGKHSILQYVDSTRTITKLLESITDSGGEDILEFSLSDKINHVDIIHRDDEGDLVAWTEGTTSPKKINVDHLLNGNYTIVKKPFIEAAKAPFLSPPLAVYGNDSTRNANSLRKKMFQFSARPQYDDFEKPCISAYSKIPLPIGYYGSDNDIDNAKNNFITVTVETGDENVIAVEVLMRYNISESSWSDWQLVASLNKEAFGIPDNDSYDFLFYNDQQYFPINPTDTDPLFDWFPKTAKSQCLPNGNVLTYGAIEENYNNYPVEDLDVTITTENIKNVPPDASPPALTYIQSGNTWTFTVSGVVPTGTRYRIIAIIGGSSVLFADYTSVGGDTTSDVADGLRNYILANHAGYAGSITLNSFLVVPPVPGFMVLSIIIDAGTTAGSISTEKTWLWDANYIFGIVYVDEQNRDMPGVTTYANPVNSDNDFVVTTDSFSLDSTDPETPVISAEINHLPPAGAVKYYWVRRRQTYADFLFYETCDYQDPSDGYLYFCLANIEQYKEDNSQFIYGTAPINSDSRIKIVAGITGGSYDGDVYNQDYEILGTVTRTLTGGSSPGDDKTFIKVKKPSASLSPAYKKNMLVFVYTPLVNPTELADSVYWEWGEAYDIFTGYLLTYNTLTGTFAVGDTVTGGTSGATGVVISDNGTTAMTIKTLVGTFTAGETITGSESAATAVFVSLGAGVNYHAGADADQSSTQGAEFTWEEGDVYFHTRVMYDDLTTGAPYNEDDLPVMDANFSDFFASAVNDNGRGHVIEVNARETYNPVLVRFGGAYQNGTSVNDLNRFLAADFDEYDRNYGDIFILDIIGSYMKVGQRFRIGNVPILLQIIKDSNGTDTLGTSNRLLNQIVYYVGDYGVGECPEAWAGDNFVRYFIDNNRGVVCRLSNDGITPISILYKINSWATEKIPLRGSDYKIYGGFDAQTNKYIFAMEATPTDPAFTMVFDEARNGFEGERSFQPEWMVSLGTLFVTFKRGQMWTHDNPTKWNYFYNVQYGSSITGVFNDNPAIKKVFNALGYQSASNVWESPQIGDITTNSFNTQTGLQQQSKLSTKLVDFDRDGQYWYAALLRDAKSMSDERLALYEGDYLAGTILTVKLAYSGNEFVWLFAPYVTYQIAQKNF